MVTHIDGKPLNSGNRKLKAINRIYPAYINQKGAPYVNARNKPIISETKEHIYKYTLTIKDTTMSIVADGKVQFLSEDNSIKADIINMVVGTSDFNISNGTDVVEAYQAKDGAKSPDNIFINNTIQPKNGDYNEIYIKFADNEELITSWCLVGVNEKVPLKLEVVSTRPIKQYIRSKEGDELILSNIPVYTKDLNYYALFGGIDDQGNTINDAVYLAKGDKLRIYYDGSKYSTNIGTLDFVNYIQTIHKQGVNSYVEYEFTKDYYKFSRNVIFYRYDSVSNTFNYITLTLFLTAFQNKETINTVTFRNVLVLDYSVDYNDGNCFAITFKADDIKGDTTVLVNNKEIYSTYAIYQDENKLVMDRNNNDITYRATIIKEENKYTGSFVTSEIEGLDNIYYKLTTDKKEINKASTDYSEFKFNTLSIEGFVSSDTTSGGIVLKLNNGTPIKAVTSTSGAQYSMQQDEDGNNIIFGLSMDRATDTIQVTFEDDDVLEIPIKWTIKTAGFFINSVNDSALPNRDKITYKLGDAMSQQDFLGNDETQKTLTYFDTASFISSDLSFPKVKFAIKHNIFNIKSATLNTGKQVTVDTEASTIEFDYDVLASGKLSLTFDDGFTSDIKFMFYPVEGYQKDLAFRIPNMTISDANITVKAITLNSEDTIIDNQPLNQELTGLRNCFGLSININPLNVPFNIMLSNGESKLESIDCITSIQNVSIPFEINGDFLKIPNISNIDNRSCRCKFDDGSYVIIQLTINI